MLETSTLKDKSCMSVTLFKVAWLDNLLKYTYQSQSGIDLLTMINDDLNPLNICLICHYELLSFIGFPPCLAPEPCLSTCLVI